MCGRFFIEDKQAEMQEILAELSRRQKSVTTGEVHPGDVAPAIARSRSLSPAPFAMRWGFSSGSRLIINARSETAAEKPLFADSMRLRRCLIPASGYSEWARRSREKTRYDITSAQSPLIYMAGLYRLTDGLPEFTILTRQPADSIAFIHDRMPVLLPRELLVKWLSPDCSPDAILSHALTDLRFTPAPGQTQTISFFDED